MSSKALSLTLYNLALPLNATFNTGNAYSNSMLAPIPGKTPPETLEESVVHVAVQPDVGGSDNRLFPIVSFLRHRQDRLFCKFRIAFGRRRGIGHAGVERWKILFRRVGNQRRPVEFRTSCDLLLAQPTVAAVYRLHSRANQLLRDCMRKELG